ncbi:hypothetical protein CPB85DRAFT_1444403 [Mucidula mucida]|nr:hypothetical protein CPB85DRAFT_1444403 [Mucidula mucida]
MDEQDDDNERATRHLRLRKRAEDLVEAAWLINEQLDLGSEIWLKSMDQKNVGHDAASLVQDIKKFTNTGRRREPTWARSGDRELARYTTNMMGYQVPLPPRHGGADEAIAGLRESGDGSAAGEDI